MSIKENRLFYNMNSRRLERARRLYFYMVLPYIEKRGFAEVVRIADRAQAHGLYSQHTFIRDIRWSIVRRVWKRAKQRHPHLIWLPWLRSSKFKNIIMESF